jgi:hypothetical protein
MTIRGQGRNPTALNSYGKKYKNHFDLIEYSCKTLNRSHSAAQEKAFI